MRLLGSSFPSAPGQGGRWGAGKQEGAGKGAFESPWAVFLWALPQTHTTGGGRRGWGANGPWPYLQKVASVRHKLFHYLSWWGCQLQGKTQTGRKKKSLPYSKLGRVQPLTFTWANKRNILTLPSRKRSAHTEVTSICLIWIQVPCIKLCIKTTVMSKSKCFPFSQAHSNRFTVKAAFQNAI